MIIKLNHSNPECAKQIRRVFQVSYKIEAALLNAVNFPPLQRSLQEFLECQNKFYGYLKGNDLVAVVEIKENNSSTHIQSLVVDPGYFRHGIASAMMEFVLASFTSRLFTVETGVNNVPATSLYKKYGFREVKQWDTDHGVRKIRFELSLNSE